MKPGRSAVVQRLERRGWQERHEAELVQQAPHWEMEEPVGIRLPWRIREGPESQGIAGEASSLEISKGVMVGESAQLAQNSQKENSLLQSSLISNSK